MAKLTILVFLTVLICQGFSKPSVEEDDIAKAAAAGDWEGVQRILKQFVDVKGLTAPSSLRSGPTFGSLQAQAPAYTPVNNVGGSPPGRYYSQSEYSYQRANNNNGVVTEDKGGLGMINDNGRVSYYKPNHAPNTGYNGYNGYNNAGFSPYGQGR